MCTDAQSFLSIDQHVLNEHEKVGRSQELVCGHVQREFICNLYDAAPHST